MRPAGQTGKRISVIQEPAVIAVIIGPRKNSLAAIERDPAEFRRTLIPFSVARTSGISAPGSALATEPPIVPRLRVAACPTHGSALARRGTGRAPRGLRS